MAEREAKFQIGRWQREIAVARGEVVTHEEDDALSPAVARKRSRDELEAAGVLEPVEDDNGKVAFYRFHDTGAV